MVYPYEESENRKMRLWINCSETSTKDGCQGCHDTNSHECPACLVCHTPEEVKEMKNALTIEEL